MATSRKALLGRATLYGLLGTWAVLTTLNQDPRRKFTLIQRLDPGGAYIPDWRFFAPTPGTYDYHLLFRDELSDGEVTHWREVSNIQERRLSHIFWHPGRRAEKAIFDATFAIIAFNQDGKQDMEDIQLSVSYLTLLNYVTHEVRHHEQAKRTQFLIAGSTGYDETQEPTPIFMSNPHPIG